MQATTKTILECFESRRSEENRHGQGSCKIVACDGLSNVVICGANDNGNVFMDATSTSCAGVLLNELIAEGVELGQVIGATSVQTTFLKFLQSKCKTSKVCTTNGKVFYSSSTLGDLAKDIRPLDALEEEREIKPSASPEQQVAFLRVVSKLKREKRTGWVLRNVKEPESVADHSFGVAMCTMLIEDENLDWRKACQMGLVHDLAEAIVGDIAPSQGISEQDKHRMEREAMRKVVDDILGGSVRAKEIHDLWNEYEARESGEARLVKDIDRLEMILTAEGYEESGGGCCDLGEFFEGVRGKIQHPTVRSWQAVIERDRAIRSSNVRLEYR
mmetsp:Transcript_568/g.728  ORF Transcript_568/g.728 Transcript_568/m.728 type:complete len:330 (-) Transcript_568:1633-2622(-)|eukprot:CAMPEP_0203760782 /NCGR_PEP_ID=MMETSP0098-20131031/14000_1 /ASSEMBLY_ACC=CAM_ASM_000208 /TAXON_ID=96639 /ORGANISM=" , Strain NY0313808BC1" /LENGTH=329 /DNA_ID=CAMNT_0050654487 /DNA_START=41 /DNA_END=1030 /DNA_ORIENTATION=+